MGPGTRVSRVSAILETIFPNLATTGYSITSPLSSHYNCIAWSVRDDTTWWWPDPFGLYYWPEHVPRLETLEAFIAAYRTRGYEPCEDGDLEVGFEKAAIYVDSHGLPTHAARQLSSGHWTSKLGRQEDIEHHTLTGLTGTTYGHVAQFLKRPL